MSKEPVYFFTEKENRLAGVLLVVFGLFALALGVMRIAWNPDYGWWQYAGGVTLVIGSVAMLREGIARARGERPWVLD